MTMKFDCCMFGCQTVPISVASYSKHPDKGQHNSPNHTSPAHHDGITPEETFL